jgi:hypothetical protein
MLWQDCAGLPGVGYSRHAAIQVVITQADVGAGSKAAKFKRLQTQGLDDRGTIVLRQK